MNTTQNKTIIDVETTGLNERKDVIHGVGVKLLNSPPTYLPMCKRDLNTDIVGHNVRFDYKFLCKAGINIKGSLFCTKILAQLVNETVETGLKELVTAHFGNGSLKAYTELMLLLQDLKIKHIGELCKLDLEDSTKPFHKVIAAYCLEDCVNTERLWFFMREKLATISSKLKRFGFKTTPALYYIEEAVPFEKVVADMELRGIKVNIDRIKECEKILLDKQSKILDDLNKLCAKEISDFEEELYQQEVAKRKSERGKQLVERSSKKYKTKFNWDSNKHFGKLLINYFKLPKSYQQTTETGQVSVNNATLKKAYLYVKDARLKELLDLYMQNKKLQKLLSTYIGDSNHGLLSQIDNETGRIYPEFLTAYGPVTGRLASRNPNVQNFPKTFPEIKRCFVPDDDQVFIYFDYSQIELRVAAHLSQDQKMVRAFNTEGIDLHQQTADFLGIQRDLAKTLNFALIYGAGPFLLQRKLPHLSIEECSDFRKRFFEAYYEYATYLKSQIEFMRKYGFVISMFGRIRRLPAAQKNDKHSKEYWHAINQGLNFPVQSAAASICKRAMIRLYGLGYRFVNQVHDSVYIQIEKDRAAIELPKIINIAENAVKLSVPLRIQAKILNSFDETDTIGGKDG